MCSERFFILFLFKAIYTTGKYDPSVNNEPLTFTVKKHEKPPPPPEAVIPASGALVENNSESDDEAKTDEQKPEDEKESQPHTGRKAGFPNLVGFLPTQVASIPPPVLVSEPKLYKAEDEEKEKKEREEKDKKKREETNKLRDKLAAKAKEKMIQVFFVIMIETILDENVVSIYLDFLVNLFQLIVCTYIQNQAQLCLRLS